MPWRRIKSSDRQYPFMGKDRSAELSSFIGIKVAIKEPTRVLLTSVNILRIACGPSASEKAKRN
ncbi:unknown [Acetobacter sp. CAG:977]|nr:unknown [Acetobacter sp. CAG:977]